MAILADCREKQVAARFSGSVEGSRKGVIKVFTKLRKADKSAEMAIDCLGVGEGGLIVQFAVCSVASHRATGNC